MAESLTKKLIAAVKDMLAERAAGGSAIGLSIGTAAIKIVELKKVGNSWKLAHFGLVQLADDVVVNREIVNSVAVSESIKTLIGQIKLSSKSVCTSLSGSSVIIKRMTIDVPNTSELADQVFWEAEQYLPFDISDVVMDFQLLSISSDKKADVILVAVKKTVLDTYVNCVEDTGLKAKIVDVDYFALQNLYEANYPMNPGEAVAIVDIGAGSLKLVVVHDAVPVFTKDSAVGGRNLTAEIQKNLGLSYADAETLKTGGGPDGTIPQEVSELMQLMGENFAMEIKRALDFYNASSSGAPVAYVLLTGGSAKIPNLSKIVEDLVKLPVQIMNPFNSISYDPSVFTQEYLNSIASIAAVPIGLALRAGAK
jgi:type IV pilus assembly protein PilM